MLRRPRLLLPALALLIPAACQGRPPVASHGPAAQGRKNVVEVEPPGPDFRPASGQTIYVPAYSSIFALEKSEPFELAITLSIRNTDAANPILLTAVRYYDHDGQLVREYLRKPLRIGPRASVEYFVAETDTRGGISASFTVEWAGERPVASPVVEAVMIGAASTQGISLICPGRVLTDRSAAGPEPAPGGRL